MAPAEVETFIIGKGSGHQRIDGEQEFQVGTIQAGINSDNDRTSVNVTGRDASFVVRRKNSLVVASGRIEKNALQVFLRTGEVVEVTDYGNRIKVTDKSTPTL